MIVASCTKTLHPKAPGCRGRIAIIQCPINAVSSQWFRIETPSACHPGHALPLPFPAAKLPMPLANQRLPAHARLSWHASRPTFSHFCFCRHRYVSSSLKRVNPHCPAKSGVPLRPIGPAVVSDVNVKVGRGPSLASPHPCPLVRARPGIVRVGTSANLATQAAAPSSNFIFLNAVRSSQFLDPGGHTEA